MLKYKFQKNGHTKISRDTAGVYAIVNILNNKKYIGSSSDIRKRYRQHYSNLSKNSHINVHLQRAFNKYGESYFEFWILEKCENIKATLISIEQKYINSDGSYNICKLATHHSGEVYTGHKISEEHRKIIAESNRNRIWTEESRKKLSMAAKNSNNNKLQRKAVLQFDLCGNLLAEHASIADAAKTIGNINCRVQIKRCCQNKVKTAYKFKWKFKNDNEIIFYKNNNS